MPMYVRQKKERRLAFLCIKVNLSGLATVRQKSLLMHTYLIIPVAETCLKSVSRKEELTKRVIEKLLAFLHKQKNVDSSVKMQEIQIRLVLLQHFLHPCN